MAYVLHDFNPDVYPMNLAWLFGTITEEEMEEEHPLELERLSAETGEDTQSGDIVVENGGNANGSEDDGKEKDT